MTKKAKLEQYDQVEHTRDLFMLALNDQINEDITWSGWHPDPYSDGEFRAGVSRVDSPSGGILLLVFRHPRQRDYVTVHDLDGFGVRESNSAIRDALYDARNSWDDSHEPAIASAYIAPAEASHAA